jgi:polygalacturonase
MSNVRDFGAVGDGSADDTAAIQHAIDVGDGQLELPRGDYRITRSLDVSLDRVGRFSISGQGAVAKLIMNGPGPALFLRATHSGTADPLGFHPTHWQRERMPTVRNLEIEGRHAQADGIRLEGVMQPTLMGLLIREVRHAVHVTRRARNVTISHCHFYHNTGCGVFLDHVNLHQTVITGCHISYCRLGGIRIEESEIRNLQITGNDIEYNNDRTHDVFAEQRGPAADIWIDVGREGSVREGTISGNTIQATYSSAGANIRILGGEDVGRARAGMWTITGNLIGSQQTNLHLTATRGVAITGNYIYSGHHRNILVEASRNIVIGPNCLGHNPDYQRGELATGIRFVDCHSCNLTGLLIEDAEAGRHTLPEAIPLVRTALLELIRCRRMNVSGCQFLDGTPHGVYVEDCSDTVLTGCTVVDDRLPCLMHTAILWKGDGSGNMIGNSRIGRGVDTDLVVPSHVRLVDNALDHPGNPAN